MKFFILLVLAGLSVLAVDGLKRNNGKYCDKASGYCCKSVANVFVSNIRDCIPGLCSVDYTDGTFGLTFFPKLGTPKLNCYFE